MNTQSPQLNNRAASVRLLEVPLSLFIDRKRNPA